MAYSPRMRAILGYTDSDGDGVLDTPPAAGSGAPVDLSSYAKKSELKPKADKTYVDGELAKKADSTAVAAKADKTYVDAELAKKTSSGSGIKEVSKAPELSVSNGRIQEYYATAAFTLHGEKVATDTAFAVRQKADGTWQIAVVGKDTDFRAFGAAPTTPPAPSTPTPPAPAPTQPSPTTYSAEVLKDNPAVLLTLDEGAIGSVTNKGSVTGMKLALAGGATMGGSAIGTLGKSLNINDSTNASFMTVEGGTLPAYAAGTLECVVSLESPSAGIATFVRLGANLESLKYQGFSGKMTSTQYVTSGGDLTNGQYHLAVVWDGTNMLFYKNGSQVASKPYAGGTPLTAISGGKIGAGLGGRIAGVAFTPTALPAARIQAHAKAAGLV